MVERPSASLSLARQSPSFIQETREVRARAWIVGNSEERRERRLFIPAVMRETPVAGPVLCQLPVGSVYLLEKRIYYLLC